MNQNLNTGHLQHQHQYSQHSLIQQQHISQTNERPSTSSDANNVLVYVGDDNPNRGSAGAGMTIHDCPMPSSWAKHQPQQHPSSPANITLPMSSSPPTGNNSCPTPSASSYGAYSQQETQTFYPVDHPYEENSVVERRATPNFNSNTGFYPIESSSSDFYQNTHTQFQSFDSAKSSCGGDDGTNSSNMNFFSCNNSSGFYPSPGNHHYNHQTQEFQNHSGPGGGKYFRNNYNNQVDDSSNYFAGGSQSRVPGYGQQDFRNDHSSQSQQPYRRNSIESFSTEPGELAYNSKYGSFSNNSNQFVSHSKRGTFVSTSWSNTDNSTHGHGACQGYFFANQPTNSHSHNQSHRNYTNSNNNNFGQECGSPSLTGNNGSGSNYPQHQQHQQQQFVHNFNKSCSFEDAGQVVCPSQVGDVGVYRAAPLKHRSLSLQYPRSDQLQLSRPDQQQQRMFQIRTHNNYSTNTNTNKNVPVVSEIQTCPDPDSGSSPVSQYVGENGSISSESSNTSPVPDDPCSVSSGRTNVSASGCVVEENTIDNDDDCGAGDALTLDLESSGGPSQSNQSELNNNNNNCNSEELSSRSSNSSSSIGNGSNLEDDLNKNDAHNIISTTTSGGGDESTCHQVELEECDISAENDNDLSNSSSLALFDSITLMNTLTSSPLSDNGDGLSGMSGESIGGDGSGEIGGGHSRHHSDKSPQKISKRSFSEADKDLVINTSAITAAMAFGIRRNISVPVGWKRELNNNSHIIYTSPSSTKLRTWEELKNYVSSDGTCKCGLNCPLWLEHTFSFDPKVRNTCLEEEESLLNLNGKDVKMETRFCCNHKRKTPSSEDYPLISSTRDDLGDCVMIGERQGKSLAKKGRISGAHGVCTSDTSNFKSMDPLPKTPTSSPAPQSQNVSVPFSQQSPDTTTQTPQRDMSPASSVSSEPSSANTYGHGSRSANTTPTPSTSKTSPPTATILTSQGQGQYEFAWPTTPSMSTVGTTCSRTPTPPSTTTISSNNTRYTKKPSSTSQNQNCNVPKVGTTTIGGIKRSHPCPNIDVRQIPLEQNQPPPRLNQTTTTKESLPLTISYNPSSSHINQNQNPTVSFIPVTSGTTTQSEHSIANLNTGYSISPVIPNVNVSAVNIGTYTNNSTYQFANVLPMQMPVHRVITTSTSTGNFNANMLIPQSLARSITISMVEQQQEKTPNGSSSSLPTSTVSTLTNVESKSNIDSLDRVSEKSPLQLVQDVVDRFHNRPGDSGGITTSNQGGTGNGTPDSKNDSNSVSTTVDVSKSLNLGELTTQPTGEMKASSIESIGTPTIFSSGTMAITSSATLTSIDTDAERQKVPSDGITNLETGLPPSISIFPASSSISIQPALVPNSSSGATANTCITTSSMSANVPIMAHAPLLSCTSNAGGFNLSNLSTNGNSLILQQQPDQNNQNSLFATATSGSGGQSLRYPLFQTLQPIILNSNGQPGSLIISPQSQTTSVSEHPSFIQIDQNQHHQATADMLQTTATTMMIDSSLCGGVGQSILCGGPKKKKKRLSKKQQQQQAQLQLQQQLLLQQLHQQVQAQQVQAAAQQQIPLLFPSSFGLGQQGFSLQPMNMNMNMNFYPTPTILTLPNIILNPADGTLFIQQPSGTPLSATTATTSGTNIKISNQFPMQTLPQQQQNLIAPKKDNSGILEVVRVNCNSNINEICLSSDDSRQNATPDSSTNDCQLGLVASSIPNSTNSITVSLPLSSSTNLPNKKLPLKSKAVSSSSSSVKRILPQKQILPKIDSTTPSVENT